jgi:hypothetical protein
LPCGGSDRCAPANGLPANGLPANGLPANGLPANAAGTVLSGPAGAAATCADSAVAGRAGECGALPGVTTGTTPNDSNNVACTERAANLDINGPNPRIACRPSPIGRRNTSGDPAVRTNE